MSAAEWAEGRRPAIVILDFGSQYSELIARRVRETEVYSFVMSHTITLAQLRELSPKGIILSGGLVTGAGLTLSGSSTGGTEEGPGRPGRGTEEAQDTSMPTIATLHAAR